jgi:hypothetical protein
MAFSAILIQRRARPLRVLKKKMVEPIIEEENANMYHTKMPIN